MIAGTPDDCIAQIRTWQEVVKPDHLLISLSGTQLGADSLKAAIELFGREVLPAVT
jgi:alkanesulfonate monooxygenase SsuD/methylene tetrahydromethanopterin reductase-like flavin-dependent oxidoreductase (luciferase family)